MPSFIATVKPWHSLKRLDPIAQGHSETNLCHISTILVNRSHLNSLKLKGGE